MVHCYYIYFYRFISTTFKILRLREIVSIATWDIKRLYTLIFISCELRGKKWCE